MTEDSHEGAIVLHGSSIAREAAEKASGRSNLTEVGVTEALGTGTANNNIDWGESDSYAMTKGHAFVGLSNQGATCYMNSLLQTLYMTPEFRTALYQWEYQGEEEEEYCIPLQLQVITIMLSNPRHCLSV